MNELVVLFSDNHHDGDDDDEPTVVERGPDGRLRFPDPPPTSAPPTECQEDTDHS